MIRIDKVTLTTLAQAYDILFDPHKYRPESRETADHSLPYCIAAALVDHKITIQSFSDEKLKDPRIWEVIDKIKGEPSQEFEKMFAQAAGLSDQGEDTAGNDQEGLTIPLGGWSARAGITTCGGRL